MSLLIHGDVVELVDTLALGASVARREGSSPFIPTINNFVIFKLKKEKLCHLEMYLELAGIRLI
jgi:hypothetical protein